MQGIPVAAAQHEACTVCLGELDPRGGSPIINPGCGHQLHLNCYQAIIASPTANSSCPQCRASFQAADTMGAQPADQNLLSSVFGTSSSLESSFVDDLLDDTNLNAVNNVTNIIVPPPALSWTPEYEEFPPLAASGCKFTALLSVRAPELPDSAPQASVDTVVVIDVSGSMSGSKIETVKRTLIYVIDTLSAKDRLCIVEFDTSALQLSPFIKCDFNGKFRLKEVVNRMHTKGGTAIGSGLAKALDVLAARAQKNKASAILLLSDGQDNHPTDYTKLLVRANQSVMPIFTFGFGSDHDASVLTRIAGESGTFTYVSEVAVFYEAFGGCMGGVKSTLFRELRVAVQVAEIDGREVKLDNIKCSYSVSIDASSKLAVVSFGDLFEDEQRDLLITVSVSPSSSDVNAIAVPTTIHLAGANSKYKSVIQNVEAAGLPDGHVPLFVKTSPNAPSISVRNPQVTGQQLRFLALDAMQVSMQLADSGNYSIAVERLNNAIKSAVDVVAQAYVLPEVSARAQLEGAESTLGGTTIPTNDLKMYTAVISDLKNSVKRCESSTAHNSFGGKLGQNNITKTYQSQRATYTAFGAVQENVFAQTSAMQTSFGYHNKKSAIAQRAASSAFGNFSVSASPVSGNNAILGNKVKPKTSWSFFGKGSGSRNPPPPPPPPAGI